MTSDWRIPVNQMLYTLTYSNEIDDEAINFNCDSAVQYTTLELGPEAYYQAIGKALASGEPLDEVPLLPQFDQVQIAKFLRGASLRLDELRPWRDPEVRPLDAKTWSHFGHAAQIAQLDASIVDVTEILLKGFRPIGDAQPGMQVLMLRLETGETVALLGSYFPDDNVALLTDVTFDREKVIEHFVSATGFPADKVTAIVSDDLTSD